MYVLYIGNFKPVYSTENEYLKAWRDGGDTVTTIQENELPEFDRLRVDWDQIDYVAYTRTWGVVSREFWDRVPVPRVGVHLDKFLGVTSDGGRREQLVREDAMFHGDLFLTADGDRIDEYKALGVNAAWQPPGSGVCLPDSRVLAQKEQRLKLVFVGSYHYHEDWPWRQQLIHRLQDGWPGIETAFYGPHFNQTIRGEALAQVYTQPGSVMVLDWHGADTSQRYWSDRLPETLCRAGAVIGPEQNIKGIGGFRAGDMASFEACVNRVQQAGWRALWDEQTMTREAHRMLSHYGTLAQMVNAEVRALKGEKNEN